MWHNCMYALPAMQGFGGCSQKAAATTSRTHLISATCPEIGRLQHTWATIVNLGTNHTYSGKHCFVRLLSFSGGGGGGGLLGFAAGALRSLSNYSNCTGTVSQAVPGCMCKESPPQRDRCKKCCNPL